MTPDEKRPDRMRLLIASPTEVVVDEEAAKVAAEAENGHFCLLPRHVDFVAALVPGLVGFEPPTGGEAFVAVDGGMLVKRGEVVRITTGRAVRGEELGRVREAVREARRERKEREKRSRNALDKMEADLTRALVELEER